MCRIPERHVKYRVNWNPSIREADDAAYNKWQQAPHAGPWSDWNRLGGGVKQLVAICKRRPTRAHGANGTGWAAASAGAASRNSDGRLEVFGIGMDNRMYNIWQTIPHAGPWSGWNKLS
jgi:hypothetical protein